ncbi:MULTISPECIES: hypothetical protein [Streptomyces]|uniref:Putative membrane protein n=1 Tax=Streptomyces scabiei (strain 87.22) TaxID=680198 RepID=C9YUA2_STRSW|nr:MULTISPECIES: hypothetical protein [Streptomyces]MDW8477960.1 hypothetical protein [Streptomyces scabiei]MDX2536234.1 hypothetical protein [Streptomyces scabiei]MDX2566913.1 hypothetical protein [Streptomyces scabiei]MDX2577787.1 hypothetical protein [Streptomyces scabiei]MDX2627461.1 hypothetical protein [Streptomyces scabiei]
MSGLQWMLVLIVVSFLGLGAMAWKGPEIRQDMLKLMGGMVVAAVLGYVVSSVQGIRW